MDYIYVVMHLKALYLILAIKVTRSNSKDVNPNPNPADPADLETPKLSKLCLPVPSTLNPKP